MPRSPKERDGSGVGILADDAPDAIGKVPRKAAYVTFGSGIRLATLPFIADRLEGTGFTVGTLEDLLRQLGVPVLHAAGAKWIDMSVFALSLKSALMQGMPDFVVGSGANPHDGRGDVRFSRKADPEEIARNVSQIVQQIVAARELSPIGSRETMDTILSEMIDAANRVETSLERARAARRAQTLGDR